MISRPFIEFSFSHSDATKPVTPPPPPPPPRWASAVVLFALKPNYPYRAPSVAGLLLSFAG